MTSPGNSFAGGMGCALVGMGLVAFAFGVAGLLGAGVELEFFGIPLNDRAGRWIWVAGSVAASGIGILLLRRRPRA